MKKALGEQQLPSHHDHSNENLINWLIFILLSIVWGSSFILIKKGLDGFSAVQLALLRVSISGLAFLPIFFISNGKLPPKSKIPYIALVGLFGSGFPAILYAIAELHIQSAVAGILNATTPIFTLLLGIWIFRVVRQRGQFGAVFLGFLGVIFLLISHDFSAGIHINVYTLLVLLATVSYGISGNIVKKYCQDIHPISLTAISFFCMLWVTLPVLVFFTDFFSRLSMNDRAWLALGAIALLSLFGTVLANILFFRLIQRTDAVFASSVSYCIPITAIIWGLLDGEVLYWNHFTGMVLILLGVYLLGKGKFQLRPRQN